MSIVAVVLAHERGWDEFLLVAAPIVVIIGLLVVVKRRIEAQPPDQSDADPPDDHTDPRPDSV